MFGTSIFRAFGLSGLALVALGATVHGASAGGNHGEPPPVYETYTGPPIQRHKPGIRLLFGDYALTQDQYNQLYDKKKKKIDETYYEPQPVVPAKPKPVKPATKTATAPTDAAKINGNPALPQKTQTASAAKPLADGPLTCEKATEGVSGYGFSSVEASSCTGRLYDFNAKRGGKSFAIKLDSTSGELTEVKKLP